MRQPRKMRLIDAHKFPPEVPKDVVSKRPYVILSHTWGDDEVTLSDLREPQHDHGTPSWKKIAGAQQQAIKHSYDWIWIDSLCIDKSSSAEVSEAINSMYRWYQDAQICYVYLSDMPNCPRFRDWNLDDSETGGNWMECLKACRWFKRGWTLQELIAPSDVRFYNADWNPIGTLKELAAVISRITNIHLPILQQKSKYEVSQYSIAQRMSWAALRETTRPEDRAYSLLGLFDMNLDIRYGEGERAFVRLQEELIQKSNDESILAWDDLEGLDTSELEAEYSSTLLASSPDQFASAHQIAFSSWSASGWRMTNVGLSAIADIVHDRCMVLRCRYLDDPTVAIGLNIHRTGEYLWDREFVDVLLRPSVLDASIASRLTPLNVIEVADGSVQHEVIIQRSEQSPIRHLPVPDPEQPSYFVWLRLADENEPPSFRFQRSSVPVQPKYGNLVWPVRRPGLTSLQDPSFRLTATVVHESGASIDVRLEMWWFDPVEDGQDFATLKLTAVEDPAKAAPIHESEERCGSEAAVLPLFVSVYVTPVLRIAATLRYKRLNESDVYMITLTAGKSRDDLWKPAQAVFAKDRAEEEKIVAQLKQQPTSSPP